MRSVVVVASVVCGMCNGLASFFIAGSWCHCALLPAGLGTFGRWSWRSLLLTLLVGFFLWGSLFLAAVQCGAWVGGAAAFCWRCLLEGLVELLFSVFGAVFLEFACWPLLGLPGRF